MLSYRFANRLRARAAEERKRSGPSEDGQSGDNLAVLLLGRERELLENCLALLEELSEMGGHGHELLRASVHDMIADCFLLPNPAPPRPNPPPPTARPPPQPASAGGLSFTRQVTVREEPAVSTRQTTGLPASRSAGIGESVGARELEKSLFHLKSSLSVLEAMARPDDEEENSDDGEEGAGEMMEDTVRSPLFWQPPLLSKGG